MHEIPGLVVDHDQKYETVNIELGKRFYVQGVVLRSRCPKCGSPWAQDLGRDYLSEPIVGRPTRVLAYCTASSADVRICGEEWIAGYLWLAITIRPCTEFGGFDETTP